MYLQYTRLVGMQAGDFPYEGGLLSSPFAFIRRLRNNFQLDQACACILRSCGMIQIR